MNKDLKKIIRKIRQFLVVMITVASLCCHSGNMLWAAEYASLIDAIQATTSPRTYTLDANETTTTVLGNIGGSNSVLTIDGGDGNYGITNNSTANEVRLFVSKNQTVYLQNLGTYTTTTSDTIVDGVNIITGVTVGNSVNNFGKNSDRVGFLRSAGTSYISNSVFYNNRGKYGIVQNREEGTMAITGSVFVGNSSPQGAVHNDGLNNITEISDSIFYNNTAVTQPGSDPESSNLSGSAIFNKPGKIIDSISNTQFVSNNTVSNVEGQKTGTIYNAGIIGEILNSVFYNNTNQRGAAINNISGSTINTISGTTFVQNTTSNGSGAAILNAIGSTIDTITDSNFFFNTATSNGGAIYNEGEINTLSGTFKANSADSNGGAIYNTGTINDLGGTYTSNSAVFGGALYNDGTITNAINATFGGDNATDGNSADKGGAIYNAEGKTLSVASTSIFKNNTATDGGAIYNAGTISDLSGTYTSNSANSNGGAIYNEGTISALAGTYTSNNANSNGGAIYNTGTISDLSGTFTSNTATTNGGAIYNTGTVTITSSDGADTTFSGNTVGGFSNAIYNTGTVNMNAGTDSSIVFNDRITGSNGTINIGGNGTVEFNETITDNSVALNSGTLKLGSANILANVTNFTSNGGTLDLRDGEIHNYQLGQNTTVNGTVGLAIDAALAGTTPVADIITAAGTVSGSGSFVFSAANIDITSYPTEQIPFWVQVTDENLRNNAGLGSNANIHITGSGTEGFLITYETSHDSVDAGFLKFEHDTLASAIASSIEERAYTMGTDESLSNTPALGGTSLSVNGNSNGYSITGDGGAGITVGNGQTLSLNNIGIDSTDNVTGAGLNNFSTAVTNNANGTLNIYNTEFSNNTTDIDNNGVANMSGIVIFDTLTGTGTTNITTRIDGNSSTVTVNNSLEQNNINVVNGNTLTNDNATITVNAALNNAGTISGTGTSSLVINGNSNNTGTIEEGTLVLAANTSLTNTGDITINTALTNNGTIANNNDLTLQGSAMTNAGTVTGSGTTYVIGQLTNNGTISQNEIQISSGGELISNASNITAANGITNDGTLELTGGNIISDILGTSGTTNITGNVTNTDTHSIANAVDVQAGGQLTTNADALLNTTNNDGTLELTGGTVNSDISGSGSLEFTNSIQNSADITQGTISVDSDVTLTNNSGATITTTDATGFQNNGTVSNEGTITVAGGSNAGSISGNGTFVNNGDFTNSSTINQSSITNSGTITTNSENLVASSGITNNGTLVYNAGSQTVSDITGDGSANSHVELKTDGTFTIDNTIANTYVDLYNSTLLFGNNGDISGATALNVNGGGIDLLDGNITSTDIGTVELNADATLGIDFDLSTLTSDSFTATVNNNGGIFNINQVNLIGTTTQDDVSIHLGDATGLGQSNVTSITMDLPSIMTPIRQINGHLENGWLTYAGGSDISDFNPAVLATPVIAQAGMRAVMDNNFRYAYEHADWYTKFSAEERFARLATGNAYQDNSAIWFKSYATFEDISLKPGPKADVKSYGSLLGLDSSFQDWGRGWYGVTTGYIGYNGAQIKYPEVSASMNGGLFGITQTFYKNNFWTGVTANVGANFADAHTMYGSENSSIFNTGLGSQTGYNIELGSGNFILQPIWYMNYSMINTFAYTNAAGVKIDPKALHTIQLNPTLRLVGNVKGWQPYVSVGFVWNLMGKTDVMADDVNLPEISIKPYLLYNLGVQKVINDRFTGFVQVMGHNGGRDGIDIVGGLRWAFGKSAKNSGTVVNNNRAESSADIQNIKEQLAEKPVKEVQDINAEQENIETETPVVNVQETDKEQQNNTASEPAEHAQKIYKNQSDIQVEKPVATVQNIGEDKEDIKAEEVAESKENIESEEVSESEENIETEETVSNALENEDGQNNAESKDPASKTQNNNLAMAVALCAIAMLVVFLLRRKNKR